jgi:hypothetical protein
MGEAIGLIGRQRKRVGKVALPRGLVKHSSKGLIVGLEGGWFGIAKAGHH